MIGTDWLKPLEFVTVGPPHGSPQGTLGQVACVEPSGLWRVRMVGWPKAAGGGWVTLQVPATHLAPYEGKPPKLSKWKQEDKLSDTAATKSRKGKSWK
jgi:hypothetical protein